MSSSSAAPTDAGFGSAQCDASLSGQADCQYLFFSFVAKHGLAECTQETSSEQIQVSAVYLNHLYQQPPKCIHIRERLELWAKKRRERSDD